MGLDAALPQEESKKLRQKQRDKTKPKMGKLDIDYQVCLLTPDTLLVCCFCHWHWGGPTLFDDQACS